MSAILHPHKYLANQDLSASFVGSAIDCRMLESRRLTITASWTAVASTDGDLYIEVSDDPRVETDKIRGTSTAIWIKRTIPAGSYDGSNFTVAGKLITLTASAGDMSLNLIDVSGFFRIGWTRRAGGAANQLQVWISGN